MKAMNFQDDNPSFPIDDFEGHYLLVFDLTSMQEITDNCHYLELVGEPLRQELILPDFLKTILNSLYEMNECRRLQLTSLLLLERECKNGYFCSATKYLSYPSAQCLVPSVRSPQTLFQLLIMTLLLLSTRNPAICRVNIGS